MMIIIAFIMILTTSFKQLFHGLVIPTFNMRLFLDNLHTQPTRNVANAQRDGRPAEYRWRPLFNAAKFG